MSAVSNRVMPASSAARTTEAVCAASSLRPKLLQPSPTIETIRPQSPSGRWRIVMIENPTLYSSDVTSSREISSILQRAADGGRISPEEALLLYTDAPLH